MSQIISFTVVDTPNRKLLRGSIYDKILEAVVCLPKGKSVAMDIPKGATPASVRGGLVNAARARGIKVKTKHIDGILYVSKNS